MITSAIKTVKKLLNERFPNCQTAFLCGSIVRGEGTPTSDLDTIVFDNRISKAYRESIIYKGWMIELFVHNTTSYKDFFEEDKKLAEPSLQQMLAEGIILKEHPLAHEIKKEAIIELENGPLPWTENELEVKHYQLTDLLLDFEGTDKRSEGIFIAAALAEAVQEFILRTNGQWIGKTKWIPRALRKFDPQLTQRFVAAFDSYFKENKKDDAILLVDQVLEKHGGRLFHGYSQGKEN